MELAALDGSSPDGRLWIPGHSVEVAWFRLHALEFLPEDDEVPRVAHETIEGSMEGDWDREHGGLLYLMDIEGKPVLLLEHFMKLWWVQMEAIYALVLVELATGPDLSSNLEVVPDKAASAVYAHTCSTRQLTADEQAERPTAAGPWPSSAPESGRE